MRITDTQREAIKSAIATVVGADSCVWLFGSRVDDAKRGGDIDLLVETERVVPNRAAALCRIEGALVARLGEQKFDVLLRDARTSEAPIFRAAREQGVLL